MEAIVNTIIEPMTARTSKAGKPYTAMKVEIELGTGEVVTVLSFNEVSVGDTVPVEKNGDYWNIVTPKKATGVDLSPVLDSLEELKGMVDQLLMGKSGKDYARAKADELRKPELDEVYEPEDG